MFRHCIPSWVAVTDDGDVLVGEEAKRHAAVDPGAVVTGFKRLLGNIYTLINTSGKKFPYKIVHKNAAPYIELKTKSGGIHRHAEELTVMLLAKLKATAEAHLTGAGRRRHAISASWVAGMEVERILEEPIAAAVAYGLHRKMLFPDGGGNAIVLHVGGGTAEASVLTLDEDYGVFDFLAAQHDSFLGGDDFDDRIVGYFVDVIKNKHGVDIADDVEAVRKLRTACEQAKKVLSTQRHAQLRIKSLIDGLNFSETLTREKFEELNHDLFLKIVALVDKAISGAELLENNKKLIDEVVLIGGSTMIPKIQELVKDYFDGKKLNTELKPDEAAAFGGALAVGHSKNASWL
uniref:Uncharacterized protein n=1 Tax=Leersia perrieri TaxID=77586 RepID=A0A0D9XX08_9ORYZ